MLLAIIFVCVVVSAFVLGALAPSVGLLAHPGEHRKHSQPTPLVGGIAIFIGLLLGFKLFELPHSGLLASMTLLFVVGVLDDRFSLPSWLRIIVQGIAAYLMVEFTGVRLESLGAIFSDTEVVLGSYALPVTIFAVIGVINAINMSDGMDGLAASLIILVLAVLFLLDHQHQPITLITMASVAGFLVWNIRLLRPHAKIFMGDAGSTLLGLVIAFLLIDLSQQSSASLQPVSALWLLALPLFDAVGVLLVRSVRGQSPFSADHLHYHHLIRDRGWGVNQTLILVLVLQAILISLGLGMMWLELAEKYQLLVFLLAFSAYFLFLLRKG